MAGISRKYSFDDWPLRGIVSDAVPNYWLFFDTETRIKTDPLIESHTFRMAWSCLWSRKETVKTRAYQWQFWQSPERLNEYIHLTAKRVGKLVLLGHNVYFDLQVCGFFTDMARRGWSLRFLYDSHGGFILKCALGKNTLLALSTTNWYDAPLADLGELVGKPKLTIDFERCSEGELKTYCRRDVEILTLIMRYYIDFITANRLGKLSFTKASQAFTAYRFRFLSAKIRIHRNEPVLSLERSAYTGGRCECFFIGAPSGAPFVCLDVNSMYPYVMSRHRYPCQLVDYRENLTPEPITPYLKKFCLIAHVEISTPEPVFAVKDDEKLIFPIGEFDCYLCSTALDYALNRGYVKNIKRLAIYRAADLFTDYVHELHHLRSQYQKANNNIMELLTKYMLNSLYGKFGQQQPFEEREPYNGEHEYYREEILDMVTGEMITHSYLMNTHIVRYGHLEARNSFAAIAAHVTENARMLLWNIISSIGSERVLYCDTDSIIIRKSDLRHVHYPIDNSRLGALKVQHTYNSLYIGGAKYYVTEANRHIKGIPEDSREIAPGVFEFYYWPKMTYHLRHGIRVGYHRRRIRRVVNLNYDKGIVAPGGRVTPRIYQYPGAPF